MPFDRLDSGSSSLIKDLTYANDDDDGKMIHNEHRLPLHPTTAKQYSHSSTILDLCLRVMRFDFVMIRETRLAGRDTEHKSSLSV